MNGKPTVRVDVPEQGFSKEYEVDNFSEFIKGEIDFVTRIAPAIGGGLTFQGRGFPFGNLVLDVSKRLQTIRERLTDGDDAPLLAYLDDARNMRVVVGQGSIGKKIEELIGAKFVDEAAFSYAVYSQRSLSLSTFDEVLKPIRAALATHPMSIGFSSLASAEDALRFSKEAAKRSEKTASDFGGFVRDKSQLISELEELFRKKLPVEEPALLWKRVAKWKTFEWIGWLILFLILALGPLAYWALNAEDIAHRVYRMTIHRGELSWGGVAAITIPGILYLWAMKNVSRAFQQRMAIADDASYRHALATTYLGLAKEQSLNITEQDRALILNALFRPVPTSSADDGPPAGLMDLIKK